MTPSALIDTALSDVRRQDATPDDVDHALAVLDVLQHDPLPDLTRALAKLAAPHLATRRRALRERWHNMER